MLRFRVTESLSIDEFLTIGKGCAMHVETHIGGMGVDLARVGSVLDFGCGCGRTLRWLIAKYPATRFYGTDVDEEAIRWCRATLAAAGFVRNSPFPPLPFPDECFDVIYCFSVFTHLDEEMQDAWLRELARVLKRGGVIMLTVHGRNAAVALAHQARETLATSGLVHQRTTKLAGIVPDWYNTTWHSPKYITTRASYHFDDIRYIPIRDGLQDVVLGRKRSNT